MGAPKSPSAVPFFARVGAPGLHHHVGEPNPGFCKFHAEKKEKKEEERKKRRRKEKEKNKGKRERKERKKKRRKEKNREGVASRSAGSRGSAPGR